MPIENPHPAYPFRVNGDEIAVVEQGDLAEGRMCVLTLLRTPRGMRPLAPDVGVDDPTFTAGVDAELLAFEFNDGWVPDDFVVRVTDDQVGADGKQSVRVDVLYADEEDDLFEETST